MELLHIKGVYCVDTLDEKNCSLTEHADPIW